MAGSHEEGAGMPLLQIQTSDGLATITLDDPERRNAISLDMAGELTDALGTLAAKRGIRAVIVTGTPPAFSAGADLGDLETSTRESLHRIYEGFLAVARFPLPTIAAVNGPAVGAGLNLALACDLRIAARRARFDSRFLQLGLHPGGGHLWMLRRLLGTQGATALVLLGESLDGEAAAQRGLAWSCVDDGALLEEARRLTRHVCEAPPELVRRMKGTLQATDEVGSHAGAVAHEVEAQLWSLAQPAFRERLQAMRRRIAAKRARE
jgi:enoyl-CoA hydratase